MACAMRGGPRVEVRLEHGDQPPAREAPGAPPRAWPRAPRGGARSRRPPRPRRARPAARIAGPHPRNSPSASAAALEVAADRLDRGERRHRVAEIVDARDPEPTVTSERPSRQRTVASVRSRRAARRPNSRRRASAAKPNRRTPRPSRPAMRRAPGSSALTTAVSRPPGELDEGVLERGHRAVALEVVRLDVVHDRDRRVQRQERLVVLVGLDDEQRRRRPAWRCRPRHSPGHPRCRSAPAPPPSAPRWSSPSWSSCRAYPTPPPSRAARSEPRALPCVAPPAGPAPAPVRARDDWPGSRRVTTTARAPSRCEGS